MQIQMVYLDECDIYIKILVRFLFICYCMRMVYQMRNERVGCKHYFWYKVNHCDVFNVGC